MQAQVNKSSEAQERLENMFEPFRSSDPLARVYVDKEGGEKYIKLIVDNKLLRKGLDYCLAYDDGKSKLLVFPYGAQPYKVDAVTFDTVSHADNDHMVLSIECKKAPRELVSAVRMLRNRPAELVVEENLDGVVVFDTWKASSDNHRRKVHFADCIFLGFLAALGLGIIVFALVIP